MARAEHLYPSARLLIRTEIPKGSSMVTRSKLKAIIDAIDISIYVIAVHPNGDFILPMANQADNIFYGSI